MVTDDKINAILVLIDTWWNVNYNVFTNIEMPLIPF